MAERLDVEVGFGPRRHQRDESDPMRLLVLGDFTGKAIAERPALESRSTQRVDIDNFDDVMRRLAPRLTMRSGEIQIQQLDDFHPDALYARLDRFRALRQTRANPPSNADDLGRLLGKPAEQTAAPVAPATGLDAMIRDIVAPHIVPDSSAHDKAFQAGVDAAITEQMRTLLHEPAFQSLEAAWRGVRWLVSSLELDENLQLHLLDVTRDELLGDVVASLGKLGETKLQRNLVDRWRNVPGGRGWSAIAGLIDFDSSNEDIA